MRRLFFRLFFAVIAFVLMVVGCNVAISSFSNSHLYSDIDDVPHYDVGVLLGTSPYTSMGHSDNNFFINRIDAAEKLYKSGKIDRILISGSDNSLDGISEVDTMMNVLVERGIPASAIMLDGKGYNTFKSVARLDSVYHISKYLVISQRFHNQRAIYLASHLVNAADVAGFNAADPDTLISKKVFVREWFARVKVFWDLLVNQ
jgi:SanA protein